MLYIHFTLHIFFLLLDIDFLFHFLMDADSRKGAMCQFCVLIHLKKKKMFRDQAISNRRGKWMNEKRKKDMWSMCFGHKKPEK